MSFKVPASMSFTFLGNAALLLLGIVIRNDTVVIGAVIVFVVLSVGVEILEAVHKKQPHRPNSHKTECE